MRRKLVPEREHFHRTFNDTVSDDERFLAARPERDTLFISAALTAGTKTYVIGETIATGVVLRTSLAFPSILLRREDVGDLVGQSVWNISGLAVNIGISESWSVLTGDCVCEEDA